MVDYIGVTAKRSVWPRTQSLGFEPGSKIGMVSKNCAHFMIAIGDLDGGYTTVVCAYRECRNRRVCFGTLERGPFGKLDTWDEIQQGVPESMPMIAFPLAPKTDLQKWDDIVATAAPIEGSHSCPVMWA